MNGDFTVEHIALHLVDRNQPGPQYSNGEVRLASFQSPEELEALRTFFAGHLREAWDAAENLRTRAANFGTQSTVSRYYQEILRNPTHFFARSRDIALRLHEVSRGLHTSAGLLMILWVRVPQVSQPFMALFKMEPGPADKITLREGAGGEILLDLAVEHIDRALPDPGDRVLKWAIMPHPTRAGFGLKVKDKEGGADLAQYFVTFLGCETRPSERRQAESLLDALATYAEQYHSDIDWQVNAQEVLASLEEQPLITTQAVVSTIQTFDLFPGFNGLAFQEKLRDFHAEDLQFATNVLDTIKVQYNLPSGILIRGPRAVMESLVQIVDVGDEKEFRIRTPTFTRTYA